MDEIDEAKLCLLLAEFIRLGLILLSKSTLYESLEPAKTGAINFVASFCSASESVRDPVLKSWYEWDWSYTVMLYYTAIALPHEAKQCKYSLLKWSDIYEGRRWVVEELERQEILKIFEPQYSLESWWEFVGNQHR